MREHETYSSNTIGNYRCSEIAPSHRGVAVSKASWSGLQRRKT